MQRSQRTGILVSRDSYSLLFLGKSSRTIVWSSIIQWWSFSSFSPSSSSSSSRCSEAATAGAGPREPAARWWPPTSPRCRPTTVRCYLVWPEVLLSVAWTQTQLSRNLQGTTTTARHLTKQVTELFPSSAPSYSQTTASYPGKTSL